jgi:L,D-transpeptidase YcbB
MPNRYAVYMHDTPAKHLFSKADHFLSHGCVRVKGVYDLAEWVLEKTQPTSSLISPASLITPSAPTTWNKQALHDKVATQEIAEIRVAKEIPVMWVYMTGWVDAEGRTHFRNDVYKRDEPPAPTSATHPDLLTASKHKNKL